MGTFTQFWTIWSENDLDDSFLQHIKVKIYLKSNTSRERAHRGTIYSTFTISGRELNLI